MIAALSLSIQSWKVRFVIAVAGVTLVWAFLDYSFIPKEHLFCGHPLLSPFYVLRSIAIAGSALFLVLFPLVYGKRNGRSTRAPLDQFTLSFWKLGRVELPGWLLPAGSFSVAAAGFGLFLAQPRLFYLLAKEDKIIEVLSALMLFLSSGVFAILFLRSRSGPSRQRRFFDLTLLLFAVVFLLIGMEEVSWFQRSLGFGTPEAFDNNLQGEFNLHNFATDHVEIAYYFFSFVFLIFLPFLHDQTDIFDSYPRLASLIPGRMVLFASASMVAYTYDTWNISLDQLAYFSTLFILIHYLYRSLTGSDRQANSPVLPAILLVGLLVFQGGFLAFGELFVRHWDVTEYKELLIPLGFFAYSLQMSKKENGLIPSGVLWTCVAVTLVVAALRLYQKFRV